MGKFFCLGKSFCLSASSYGRVKDLWELCEVEAARKLAFPCGLACPGAQFLSAAWAASQFPSSVPEGGLLVCLWLLLMELSFCFAAHGTDASV